MSALAFHGLWQVILWFGKFISDVFLCPDSKALRAKENMGTLPRGLRMGAAGGDQAGTRTSQD